MGRAASSEQQARAKARARRLDLEGDRAARGERIDSAAATAILALDARAEAERMIRAAEDAIVAALEQVLDAGVRLEDAARLCDLKVAEVQRLRRARRKDAPVEGDPRENPAADVGAVAGA